MELSASPGYATGGLYAKAVVEGKGAQVTATSKTWLWLKNLVCSLSRPTATAASAPCMRRQDDGSRPAPRCLQPLAPTGRGGARGRRAGQELLGKPS
jgi:hypothetical protein